MLRREASRRITIDIGLTGVKSDLIIVESHSICCFNYADYCIKWIGKNRIKSNPEFKVGHRLYWFPLQGKYHVHSMFMAFSNSGWAVPKIIVEVLKIPHGLPTRPGRRWWTRPIQVNLHLREPRGNSRRGTIQVFFRWLVPSSVEGCWRYGKWMIYASWHAVKVDEFPWLSLFVRNLRNVHGAVQLLGLSWHSLELLVRTSTAVLSHRIHGAGIYANIGGILMVNVTIYTIHGSYGFWSADFFCKRYLSGNLKSHSDLDICWFPTWKSNIKPQELSSIV